MDMQMPIMDGYTATRLLRDLGFTAPIIALTADAMKGTEGKCRDAGCSSFLTKPIDMDHLVSSLAEVLRANGYVTVATEPPLEGAAGPPRTADLAVHSSLPTDDPDFCEIIVEFEQRLREKLAAMRQAVATGQMARTGATGSLAQRIGWYGRFSRFYQFGQGP